MKIDFIINPNSGKARHIIKKNELQEMLGEDYIVNVHYTNYQFHAKKLVQDAIQNNAEIIVACGGDGTVNEVASALVGTNIKLGIIPVGSGNGLASNLGIPKNLKKSIQIIKNHHVIKIDVGIINQNYFFSNIGFGIEADVINQYEKKQKRTIIGYINASIKTIFKYKPKYFQIKVDHHQSFENNYHHVFCSNSNISGYNISFTPQASLQDGKLDLLLVPEVNFMEQIYFYFLVFFRRIEWMKKASIQKINYFSITSKLDSINYQLDGEFIKCGQSQLEIMIKEKSLNVISKKSNTKI